MTKVNNVFDNELNLRTRMSEISDDTFYAENPELKELDNGKGWAFAENRNVTMTEFVEYGRTDGREGNPREATRKSIGMLDQKGDAFAKYFIRRVLDTDVANYFLANGGDKYYLSALPKDAALKKRKARVG